MENTLEQKEILKGWTLCNNVHHESGSPTYCKRDKHGFITYATLEMIIKQTKSK